MSGIKRIKDFSLLFIQFNKPGSKVITAKVHLT